MNAREQLMHIAHWLGDQEESLSMGLRSSYDALRLYDHWQAHSDVLPEMADEWQSEDLIAALGYDPLDTQQAWEGRDVEATGASAVHEALTDARRLIDSVAYVAVEGDTAAVLQRIDSALSFGA